MGKQVPTSLQPSVTRTRAVTLAAMLLLVAWVGDAQAAAQTSPFESQVRPTPQGKIDQLVFAQLKRLGIEPSQPCSDEVFVRRVYLDAIGTLPTAQEVRDFLQNRDPNKRSVLIERLLERDEFADYWAMKWSDLLRVKAEYPINLWPNAAQTYYRWIRTSLKENLAYDRFVREMLCSSGSNFRVPQVNFYRAMQSKEPKAIAQTVALTFMGARAEKWPKERLAAMAVFFSQIGYKHTGEWKEEIVFLDPNKTGAAGPAKATLAAVLPDGSKVKLAAGQDWRVVFADWLTGDRNPWFSHAIANRVWSWLLGRGIIHEPDDIRSDNPPCNPELLAYLEQELVRSHYDLKSVYRLILNSQVYQLSCVPRTQDQRAKVYFATYPLRRLEAEVLIDALCQITGTTEKYSSAIPEPFTYIPQETRSIALPDGSITSSFLDMFGRPSRDTGLESERNNRPTADQRLHLLNSSHIQQKLEQGPKLRALIQTKGPRGQIVNRLYLTILSRSPTDQELASVESYSQSCQAKGPQVLQDVAWTLINSPEFLYRH